MGDAPACAPGVTRSQLANGVVVLTEQLPTASVVAVGAWVIGGSGAERFAERGAAHLLEHLAFGNRSASGSRRDYLERLDSLAAHPVALTTKEHTSYVARLRAEDLAFGLEAISYLICEPDLSAESIEREKRIVAMEVLERRGDGFFVTVEEMERRLFRGTALARTVSGSRAQIENLDVGTVRSFWDSCYARDRVVVAVAGGVEHAVVVELVDQLFAELRPVARVDQPSEDEHNRLLAESAAPADVTSPNSHGHHVLLAFSAPPPRSERAVVARVMDSLLSGGMSARLYRILRSERAVAYTAGSFYTGYRSGGSMALFARTSAEESHEASSLLMTEMQRMADGVIDDSDLNRSRAHLAAGSVIALEDSRVRAARLASSEIYGAALRGEKAMTESIVSVSKTDLVDLAQSMLNDAHVAISEG